MAGVLIAAILCGACWVHCTELTPRLNQPDIRAVTANRPPVTNNTPPVTANTPLVTANTPLVAANTPLVTANTPLVTANTPSVTANRPSVTANTPPVTANTPSVTANTPPVTANTPSVTANTPSVTANTPSVTANTPSVTANTPSVTANTPSVTANTPSVTANTPSVTANTPSVTDNRPSVTNNTPTVTANTPSETANTPSVTANTPSVTDNRPSVTNNTPTVTANTPSETANTPSVTANPPSVTANPPSVTANPPSVTANPPSVTDTTPSVTDNTPSVTANTPSVTDNTPSVTDTTPSVTDNTPSVTANTPLVFADTPSVTANTPSVTNNTPPVTASTPAVINTTPAVTTPPLGVGRFRRTTEELIPLPGQRISVEGDRVVFALDADFLAECAQRGYIGSWWRENTYFPLVHSIHNKSSAQFDRGTLKIDFRLDNATFAAQRTTEELKYCGLGIATVSRSKGPGECIDKNESVVGRWIKVPYYNSSTDGSLQLDIHGGMRFTKSLERPSVLSLSSSLRGVFGVSRERPIRFRMEWRRLPRAFSTELQLTRFDCEKDLLLNVTMTSPLKGVVRTPLWDGLSVFEGALEWEVMQKKDYETARVRNNTLKTLISVPSGHRAMISWEHVGTGRAGDCDSFQVHVGDKRKVFDTYCGASTPSPVLVAWSHIEVEVETPSPIPNEVKTIEPSRVPFTGISMRFSFHNASALPQQLADKTWNCSVAHWADFKQHLQCNLLVECAGGEDEADCPDYARGTCRHGYLAAGGSCFTFGPAPEALTSWVQAEAACRSRGAHLPTLNTPAKWRAVLDLLSHRRWENIYIGLSSGNASLPGLYSQFLQWSDSSVAYYVNDVIPSASLCRTCAFLNTFMRPDFVYLDSCLQKVPGNLLCEVQGPSNLSTIDFATENEPLSGLNITRCPKGHVIHNFLSCDPRSDCFVGCYTPFSSPLSSLPSAFKCRNGFERVPFTLVCDHREDCSDASDEICVFPPCREFECDNKQCIARHLMYDGVKDCLDGSDETVRSKITFQGRSLIPNTKPPPATVLHDGRGSFDLLDVADPSAQSTSSSHARSTVEGCPDSHFQCPGVSYYCLPVYVRCNGVRDCPGHQDEADCDIFLCPGFYRCLGSKVCLHGDHLCDGIFQCPQRDDELMCGFVCPVGCTCYGLAFYCTVPFDASRHTGLRFLDASRSAMSLKRLLNNTMLFHLSLAQCNITQLESMNFFNVFHLDLSKNLITTLTEKHIVSCQNLQVFVLAGNPLRKILEDSSSGQGASFAKLHTLDLSAVSITAAQIVNLHVFSNVTNLNLSDTGLDAVSELFAFRELRVLDLRGCPVTYFTRSVFQGLDDLSTVYADNYKLCCPETLPDGFNVLNCHAPFDEVSSCVGLLKSELYRVSLSVLTSMILLGNAGSFVYLVFINRKKTKSSFSIFVTNLCVSDFLMGLYSATIGVADRLYLGNYVWNDVTWRNSVTCKMAGVLSLVSSEVSVLIICLITVDRFLVTRFPFSRHLHFSLRSARSACVTAWSVGVLLAVAPLLPVTSHWQLYSQTGVCIPLPVTRVWFAGKQYSFGILIILNFVLFVVIASGQMSIYLSIRANSMTTSDTTQKAKDLTIARRLVTVAVSDFLCWFPVGLLGILSSRGHPIPGEVSVVIAVFVLPLNSALNPFLYTVNVILERRQRAREQRLLETILSRHLAETAQGQED